MATTTPEEIYADVDRQIANALEGPLSNEEPNFADMAEKEIAKAGDQPLHDFAIPLKSHLATLAEAQPIRMLLWRTDADPPSISKPGTYVGVQYNPTEIESGVDVDWNRLKSPGGHYAHMHFAATNNFVMEFELYFSAFNREDLARITEARNNLHAWCQPEYDDGWSIGPPRLWCEWAGSFRFQCYLVECKFKHLKFALNGDTTRYSAKIKLEEAADQYQFTGNESNLIVSGIRGLEGYQGVTSRAKRALPKGAPGRKVGKSSRGSAATQNKDRRK